MKKEVSMRRKAGTVLVAAAMMVSVFAPASFAFAETDSEYAEEQLPAIEETTEITLPETGGAEELVAVTGISLNHKSCSLKAGKTISLKASVEPSDAADKTITWTSSNEAVAVVDSEGIVTAEGPGKAVITAKAGNETAKCTIRVTFAAPTKVKAESAGLTAIQLSWKKVSGATGYDMYRAVEKHGTYQKVASVTDKTSYSDKDRITGREYFYKIKACRGEASSKFSKMVSEKARPNKTTVKLKSGEEKVTVSWKKIGGAQGYHIYYKTTKDGDYKRIGIVGQNGAAHLTHEGLKGGKTYYYKVRSYKMVKGEKVFSHGSKRVQAKAQKVKLKTHKAGFKYKRKMIVKAYAYTGGGRTATGTRARKGEIAVDPHVIPLGTKVYVEGYGYARAEDTGGNIKGRTIDLYMNSGSDCMRWGVRYKTVYLDVRQ